MDIEYGYLISTRPHNKLLNMAALFEILYGFAGIKSTPQDQRLNQVTHEHTMASNTDTSTTNCAACGKEGGNLNTCNRCHMVKYCNAACKKKHRSKHKKACERRVAELHDEELFKEPPPNEDCPICFLPLPLDASQTIFKSCCGKIICNGCIHAMREEARQSGGEVGLCAFCRKSSPIAGMYLDEIKRLKKLIEADNADGYNYLAGMYWDGEGMQQDWSKANELYLRAGEHVL